MTESPTPQPTGPVPPAGEGQARDPDRPLGWRGWVAVAVTVLAANAALIHGACHGDRPATVPGPPFADDFERPSIGAGWFATGGHWRILGGELWAAQTRNNPLWLEMRLPREVAIEFDARSETAGGSRPGDIKFEVFGNGRDHASGYVCVFGGWGNTISVIARLDEHGADRQERRDLEVEPGRNYHMRLERRGRELRWLVDGQLFLSFDDPRPLQGRGHDRFGFSSWEADLFFDNLRIEPL